MKVYELSAENFKKLSVESLKIDGKNVTVTGKNGVGKSSFIDAITIALTGKNIPAKPIKEGEERAVIEVTIKGEVDGKETTLNIKRTFTPKNSSLVVSSPDGAIYKSPQGLLDRILGTVSFDVFEFVKMTPKKQKDFICKLVGLDLTSLEERKREFLDELNSHRNRYKMLQESFQNLPEVKGEIRSTSEVLAAKSEYDNKKANYDKLVDEISQKALDIINMKEQIEQLKNQITLTNKSILDLEAKKADYILGREIDFQKLIEEIETDNQKIREYQKDKQVKQDLQAVKLEAENVKNELAKIEKEKINLIKSKKLPLDNLEFTQDGLLLNGLEISTEQLSTAELIKIGIAIQTAINPKLKIIRIKDGSLLDSDTLAQIEKIAEGYQIFIEKVSDDKEIGFEIREV